MAGLFFFFYLFIKSRLSELFHLSIWRTLSFLQMGLYAFCLLLFICSFLSGSNCLLCYQSITFSCVFLSILSPFVPFSLFFSIAPFQNQDILFAYTTIFGISVLNIPIFILLLYWSSLFRIIVYINIIFLIGKFISTFLESESVIFFPSQDTFPLDSEVSLHVTKWNWFEHCRC